MTGYDRTRVTFIQSPQVEDVTVDSLQSLSFQHIHVNNQLHVVDLSIPLLWFVRLAVELGTPLVPIVSNRSN